MTSHYTLYDDIGYNDVTYIALECCCDLKKKYSNKYILSHISYLGMS